MTAADADAALVLPIDYFSFNLQHPCNFLYKRQQAICIKTHFVFSELTANCNATNNASQSVTTRYDYE